MVKEKLDFTGLSKEDEPTFTYKGLELEKGKFDYSGLKKEPPKPEEPPKLGVPTIPKETPDLAWTPPGARVIPTLTRPITKEELETFKKMETMGPMKIGQEPDVDRMRFRMFADNLVKENYGEEEIREMKTFDKARQNLMIRAPQLALMSYAPYTGAIIESVQQAKNAVVPLIKKEKWDPFEIRMLAEILPDETSPELKLAFVASELIATYATTSAVIDMAKAGTLKSTLSKVKDKMVEAGLPQDTIDDFVAGTKKLNVRKFIKGTSLEQQINANARASRMAFKKPLPGKIPDFKSAEHAVKYGVSNKGNVQTIRDLAAKQASLQRQYDIQKAAGKTGEALKTAFKQQFIREAREAAEGKIVPGKERPIAKDIDEAMAVEKFAFYEGRPSVAKPVEQTSQPEKIIKRSDIIKEISNKLDVPVRRGKFRGKGVRGIFKPQQQVVRVKEGGFETISHEVGHYLHHTISDVNKIIENNPELKNLDYDQNKKRATEGFSEYLRYYLTQPEKAPEVAPQFHRVFNTLMDAKYPKIKEILDAARDNYKLWLEMPSVAKTESHISFNSPRPKSITIGDIYTSTIDDLYPIHKYSKLAKEYKDIQPSEDPYVLARLYRGWTGKPEHFFRRGTFDPYTLKITGQPLTSILRPIEQMKALKEFSIYLVAKRVPELTGRGIQTGINKEDAIQTVKDLESAYPIFENAKTRYRAYNMRLMQYLYKGGLLSREDFVKIIRNNREYAPFFRVHEELTRNGYMGKGFSKIASPVKRIGGSEADIIDPLESTLKNTYTIINAVERNKVGQALIRLSSLSPELGRIVERVPPKMAKVVTARLDEAFRQIKMYMPPEMKEAMKQIAFDIYRPSMFLDDNIIQVMEGGKKYYYQVEPTLYRAIQGMDAEQINTIFKIMSYPAKWLRAGATALNPDFLGRNVFRDQLTAAIYSEYGYKPFIDVYGGAASIVNQDELFWKWMRSGGAHAAIVSMDRNYLRHNLRELMRGRFKTYSPVEAVRAISEIGESATRLGEFKLALQKTGDPLKASMASREVSVDFGVHGSKTQALSSIIAFFNPNIQGTAKLIKAFKNRPKKTMLAVIAGITVPSMLLYMHNRKSERYKELPKWEKDLFWIVDVGENKPLIRIPKPFELGILFGSVPERMLEWMDTQNPEAFDGMTESIINGFVPGVMPTAATPFIENYTNKSFFTGKPVESEAVTREIPSERYYRYTPSVARWIGKRLGMSPIKIHQFVRGWFGGVGVMAMEFPDNVMKASGNADLPMSPKDIPLIKSFIARDPYGLSSYSIGKFYDDYKKIAQYHTTINRLESEEKYQEANKIRRSHPEWKYYDDYSAMSREIADMRSSQEYTLNRKDLTPEQKKKIIDAKNKNLTGFVRKFNEQHR